jgi:hypothetical protein
MCRRLRQHEGKTVCVCVCWGGGGAVYAMVHVEGMVRVSAGGNGAEVQAGAQQRWCCLTPQSQMHSLCRLHMAIVNMQCQAC